MSSLVVRKSWVNYVAPALSLSALAAAAGLVLAWRGPIDQSFREAVGASGSTALPWLAVALAFVLMAAGGAYRIALLRSAVLRIDDDGVSFTAGVLPWARTEMYWRPYQIFGAAYRLDRRFLGWLLRYGSVIVCGREGTTREYALAGMHAPKAAQLRIAALADRYHSHGR